MNINYILYPGTDFETEKYIDSLYEMHKGIDVLQNCIDDLHVSLSNYLVGKKIQNRVSAFNRSKMLLESETENIDDLSEVDIKYSRRHVFIHGHAFVYALDRYYKILKGLETIECLSSVVPIIINEFDLLFPTLRKLRNSAQHFEDSYNIKSRKKEIIPKPFCIDDYEVKDSSVYIVSTMFKDKLTYTSDDGSIGYLDISEESLKLASKNFQNFINLISWKGSPRIKPE